MRLQKQGNGVRIATSRFHAQVQGLETPMRQEAIEGRWDCPNSILNETQLVVQIFVVCTYNSHYNITAKEMQNKGQTPIHRLKDHAMNCRQGYLWPPMYFVTLWTDKFAPKSKGD